MSKLSGVRLIVELPVRCGVCLAVEGPEDLSSLVINTEEPWRALESCLLKMHEQRLDYFMSTTSWAPNRVTDPHYLALVVLPAVQGVFRHDDQCGTSEKRPRGDVFWPFGSVIPPA